MICLQALTATVDRQMRERWGALLEERALREHRPHPADLWQHMALIVLFDQVGCNLYAQCTTRGAASMRHRSVRFATMWPCATCSAAAPLEMQVPRNVHRGSARAYSYDRISRPLALCLMERLEPLPFHFRATVLICVSHSEERAHQALLKAHLDSSDFRRYERTHTVLHGALKVIHRNHFDRVRHFGRFPERNKALKRPVYRL